ncbi:MAG: hypothetical protein ACE5EH_12630, partial [Gammaproteobacteria bacterium]
MQLQLVLLFCLLFLASTVSAGPEVRSDLWITNGPIYSTEVYGSNVGSASGSSVLLDTETALMDTTWPVVSGGELKVAVSDDAGGWYIGGSFSSVGSVALNNLAHINPDHSVDTAWVPVVNGVVHTIVLAGNTLVIGGEFTQVEGDTRNHLAALFTNTTKNLLTNWDPNANGNVFTMVLSGNNLVVGGAFTQLGTTEEVTEETNTGPVTKIINPVARIGLAELSPSVPLNSTTDWSPTLIGGSATVYSLAVIGETLYVGGDFTSIEHITGENKVKTIVPRNNIAALQMNVTQDIVTNWDPNANGIVRNVFLSGDKLYAGGEFTNIGGVNRSFIAALDTTQEILNATDWDPGADAIVRTIVQSGATVYVGGDFTTIGGQARNYIAALDPQSNSGDATSWYPKVDNTVTNIIVSGNEIVAGGLFNSVIDEAKIYIAGDFTYVGPNTGPGVTVDASSAVIDSTWPYVEGAINSVVPDGAGGWFIGGIFSAVGGITRSNIAHIDNTKSLDTNWNPIIDGPVNDLILSGADLYVGGAFADVNGTPRNNIAVIGSGGTGVVNTTWNPNINGPVNTMILSAPDLYVGGAFTDVGGGTARNNIAAVESVGVGAGAGAVNATWNPNINGPVNTMILSAP